MIDHLRLRVTAFLTGLLSLIGTALIGVLLSPEFMALVSTHLAEFSWGGFALLIVNGLVNHLRNKYKEGQVGSMDDDEVYV